MKRLSLLFILLAVIPFQLFAQLTPGSILLKKANSYGTGWVDTVYPVPTGTGAVVLGSQPTLTNPTIIPYTFFGVTGLTVAGSATIDSGFGSTNSASCVYVTTAVTGAFGKSNAFYGLRMTPTFTLNSAGGATGYGAYVYPNTLGTGTWSYWAQLYLGAGPTATTKWGIYQADSGAQNGFLGQVLCAGGLSLPNPSTPASSSATGTTGQIAWDSNFLYICVNTNTWKRISLSTW